MLCLESLPPNKRLLHPFSEQVREGVISYGLSAAGYDLRLAPKVLMFKDTYGEVVDPKLFSREDYRKRVFDEVYPNEDGSILLAPRSYMLGYSFEYIRVPRYLKGRCVGKSTLARCGILVNTTPLEPNWHGHLTIEVSNINPCPVRVYAMEGIAQLELETLDAEPHLDYGSRGGKYQGQGAEPVPARII
jgi:dCTP deaminase